MSRTINFFILLWSCFALQVHAEEAQKPLLMRYGYFSTGVTGSLPPHSSSKVSLDKSFNLVGEDEVGSWIQTVKERFITSVQWQMYRKNEPGDPASQVVAMLGIKIHDDFSAFYDLFPTSNPIEVVHLNVRNRDFIKSLINLPEERRQVAREFLVKNPNDFQLSFQVLAVGVHIELSGVRRTFLNRIIVKGIDGEVIVTEQDRN